MYANATDGVTSTLLDSIGRHACDVFSSGSSGVTALRRVFSRPFAPTTHTDDSQGMDAPRDTPGRLARLQNSRIVRERTIRLSSLRDADARSDRAERSIRAQSEHAAGVRHGAAMNRWWNQPNVPRCLQHSRTREQMSVRADHAARPCGRCDELDLTTQIRVWSARDSSRRPEHYAGDLFARARTLEPAIALLHPANSADPMLRTRAARMLQVLLDHAHALGLELGEIIMLYDDAWALASRAVASLSGDAPHLPGCPASASPAQSMKIPSACAVADRGPADTTTSPAPSAARAAAPLRPTVGPEGTDAEPGSEP